MRDRGKIWDFTELLSSAEARAVTYLCLYLFKKKFWMGQLLNTYGLLFQMYKIVKIWTRIFQKYFHK